MRVTSSPAARMLYSIHSTSVVRWFENIRIKSCNRFLYGAAASADTADHLTAGKTVAGVDVNEFTHLIKDAVAELTAAVVVHRADEDHQLFAGW